MEQTENEFGIPYKEPEVKNIRASPSIGEAAYAKGQKITNTNYTN